MVLTQCFSTGSNIGFGSGNLGLLKEGTTQSGFLFAGGGSGGVIIRLSNDGFGLVVNGTLGFAMGDGVPRTPTNDFSFWACVDGDDRIFSTDIQDSPALEVNEFDTGFTNACEGTMFPIGGFKGAYYVNEGISFYNSDEVRASLSGGVNALGVGTGRDVFAVNENNIIANNGLASRYVFNPSTNNATFVAPQITPSGGCDFRGSAFIASNQVLFLQICAGPGPSLQNTFLGDSSGTNVFNFSDLGISSTTYGSIDYDFPHLFAVLNNAGNSDLISLEVISSESLPGINKKPSIENVRPTTSPVTTNQTINTFFDVNNPETATLNEQVLTANTCSYVETENFLEDFSNFNFSVCGQAVIGTRKGVEFGNGLDLTQCSVSEVIPASTTINTNMIVSFDVFATVDSTAQIELLQSDASVLTTLSFDITNNLMTVIANSETILTNISLNFAGQNVPTRIFIQMSPGTGNANLVNLVAYSTNYFSRNDDISTTFCDTSEFCFIGNFVTIASPTMNDFRALGINSATGDFAIDNFRVVTTAPYPTYNQGLVINNLNAVCFFETTSTNVNRIYASDVLYGHNYLSFTNVTYQVNQQGVITTPEIINSSIGGIINGIVRIGGFDDDFSLLILALIFMISAAIGMFFSGMAIVGVVFIEALLITLFFFLGWIPLSIFVLVGLLAAALVALVGRNLFIGGGE